MSERQLETAPEHTGVVSDTFAAVDLGSNSFHMVVARLVDGQVQILDRLREMVRLGAGLDAESCLDGDAKTRGLACLSRFGERLRELPPGSVRAVGTNTLRRARNAESFLEQAKLAIGHPVEVVSGIEEARLIYLGVVRSTTVTGRGLVIDIGGGSTEFVLGDGLSPQQMESLHMGCVSMSQRFFGDGRITRRAMERAEVAARLELEPVRWEFVGSGWESCTGASGTIRAIREVLQQAGWTSHEITREALNKLRAALIKVGDVEALPDSFAVSRERAPVFAGGFAVLNGVVESLGIEAMSVSDGALRDGVLYDLMGRRRNEDVRATTVAVLESRYAIDTAHATRVAETASRLYRQVSKQWQLVQSEHEWFLEWASHLHEIGLSIAHSQYHKHGAYVLENADLPGFSRGEQRLLAMLVRGHRRKFPVDTLARLPGADRGVVQRLCVLLRLAVLLHRGRGSEAALPVLLRARDHTLELQGPADWQRDNPLTYADLEQEKRYLSAAGYSLKFLDS